MGNFVRRPRRKHTVVDGMVCSAFEGWYHPPCINHTNAEYDPVEEHQDVLDMLPLQLELGYYVGSTHLQPSRQFRARLGLGIQKKILLPLEKRKQRKLSKREWRGQEGKFPRWYLARQLWQVTPSLPLTQRRRISSGAKSYPQNLLQQPPPRMSPVNPHKTGPQTNLHKRSLSTKRNNKSCYARSRKRGHGRDKKMRKTILYWSY